MDSNSLECPVCTLFIRSGISMRQHLETHPKELVIEALLKKTNSFSVVSATSSQSTAAVPDTPLYQPVPHFTSAVTYQQTLTTNQNGVLVPQFMQVPAFVNQSYPVIQNFGFPSTLFNPLQTSFISQNFSFNTGFSEPQIKHLEEYGIETESAEPEDMDLVSPAASAGVQEDSLSQSGSSHPSSSEPASSRSHSRSKLSCSTPSAPNSPFEESFEAPLAAFSPNYATISPSFKLPHGYKGDSLPPSPLNADYSCESPRLQSYSPPPEEHLQCEDQNDGPSVKTEIKLTSFDPEECSSDHIEETHDSKNDVYIWNVGESNRAVTSEAYVDEVDGGTEARSYTELLPSGSSRITEETGGPSRPYMSLDDIRIFYNGSALLSETTIKAAPQAHRELSPINLNIAADESMPARGELSEQESMGADSAWGYYNQDVKLVDSWTRDKMLKCSVCDLKFFSQKERRAHKAQFHPKGAKRFKCPSCDLVFGTMRERREHGEVHNAVKKELKTEELASYLRHCPQCSTKVPTVKALRTHLKEVHGLVRFKCQTCEQAFDDEAEMQQHLKVHPLKCSQCSKTFQRQSYLNLHMKRHLAIKPFDCHLCQKAFVTRQKLDEHCNSHAGIRPIKCPLCHRAFTRHSNLIQHRNIHHNDKKKKQTRDFVCRCGEVFGSLRKLEWHRETHSVKPKPCPFCSQKFIHAASVTRHVRRTHHPDYLPEGDGRVSSENVSCPVCARVYLKSSLAVHMRVHNGKRPFQCPVCSKSFTTKWNMELHRWTHQSRTQMPYKCTQCKSAFFRKSDFAAHVNSHRNLKPYVCNVCGQRFIRRYNCLRHQEEHQKAKRFTCTVNGCNRTFHRSYYLKDHLRVHTGMRPHTCHICGKASSTKSNHNKHLRIHDTREPMNTEN